MILAAGRGERMRPLTDHIPKPLLEVGGKPLIVWHIENLKKAGFNEIVINHAHLGLLIEAYLGDGSMWNVSIQYSPEVTALETAGGIAHALHLLEGAAIKREAFLVVNGDIFTDLDFAQLANALHAPNLAHLVMINNPPQHVHGDFAFEPTYQNKLILDGANKLTFSGIGVYHPDLFNSIAPGQTAQLAPLLKAGIADGLVTGQHYQGIWHDIGTPQRLNELDASLRVV